MITDENQSSSAHNFLNATKFEFNNNKNNPPQQYTKMAIVES